MAGLTIGDYLNNQSFKTGKLDGESFTGKSLGKTRKIRKEMLDENFKIASWLLDAINKKPSKVNINEVEFKFQKLIGNLEDLEAYLTQTDKYDKAEYKEKLDKLKILSFSNFPSKESQFGKKRYLELNKNNIVDLVNYFINYPTENVRLKEEDIGFEVEGTKKLVTGVLGGIGTEYIWSKMRGIESDKVKEANIVSYHPEMESRVLYIDGINTVIEPRTEFTDPDHDIYGTGFGDASVFPGPKKLLAKIPPLERKFKENITPTNYDGKDRINASGEGTNFAGIADMLKERGYGMDFLNQFHMGDRKHVEASIKKAQEFLESEEGQKVEVLICHSYGGLIAKALDLSKTNVKKVLTISSPLGEHKMKDYFVAREKYAKSVANRSVKWYSVGSEVDKTVPTENSSYADEKHMKDSGLDHYRGTYVEELEVEKWEKILDFFGIKKKEKK